MTTITQQLTAKLKNFFRGWLLALGIKEDLVKCATLCVKSEVILMSKHNRVLAIIWFVWYPSGTLLLSRNLDTWLRWNLKWMTVIKWVPQSKARKKVPRQSESVSLKPYWQDGMMQFHNMLRWPLPSNQYYTYSPTYANFGSWKMA